MKVNYLVFFAKEKIFFAQFDYLRINKFAYAVFGQQASRTGCHYVISMNTFAYSQVRHLESCESLILNNQLTHIKLLR